MSNPFPDPNAKPFFLWSIPQFPKTAQEVIIDADNIQQNMIDLLGCEFLQRRDDILAYIRLLANNESFRSKLGSVKKRPYDELSSLDDSEKEIAFTIAENAMDRLIDQISGILSDAPIWYGDNYALQYKLEGRILSFDGKKYKIVVRQQLGDSSQGLLSKAFGRWLYMFRHREKVL